MKDTGNISLIKSLHGKVSVNFVDKINMIERTPTFLYISLSKTCVIWGGAIFGHQGHNLNKFCRGSLDDATYIISRL